LGPGIYKPLMGAVLTY